MIEVRVDTPSGDTPPLPAGLVSSLVRRALQLAGATAGQVQVVFSDDAHLRRLKRRFFQQDGDTDVIAFNLDEGVDPLDGEIYISTERALENSRQFGQTHRQELMRLVAHGSLHLTGLEDGTPEDQSRMRALEDQILAAASAAVDP